MIYWGCMVNGESGMVFGPCSGSSEGRGHWNYRGDDEHYYRAPTEQAAKKALKAELERRIDGLKTSLMEYCQ